MSALTPAVSSKDDFRTRVERDSQVRHLRYTTRAFSPDCADCKRGDCFQAILQLQGGACVVVHGPEQAFIQ